MAHFTLVAGGSEPPSKAVQLGSQTDGCGQVWTGVAHTPEGDIPGKVHNGVCYYPHCGEEHTAESFSWVVAETEVPMVLVSDPSGPPDCALAVGKQEGGPDKLYAAVAVTEWGTIPGKAVDSKCWYGYSGKEYEAEKFYWVCHQPTSS